MSESCIRMPLLTERAKENGRCKPKRREIVKNIDSETVLELRWLSSIEEKFIFNMHGLHITIIRCTINWINDQVNETERFHEFK